MNNQPCLYVATWPPIGRSLFSREITTLKSLLDEQKMEMFLHSGYCQIERFGCPACVIFVKLSDDKPTEDIKCLADKLSRGGIWVYIFSDSLLIGKAFAQKVGLVNSDPDQIKDFENKMRRYLVLIQKAFPFRKTLL